jgi:hypothetical protein
MIYQIVAPFVADIYGDSFKDAVKNIIKLKRDLNLNDIIIKDQTQHMQARIKYYQEDGRNKVGINMFPLGPGYPTLGPTPIVVNDTYIPQRVITPPEIPIIAPVPLPLGPIGPIPTYLPLSIPPLSPLSPFPFMPTVINLPNI